MLALELNDAQLTLTLPTGAPEGRVVATAPGIACITDEQILTGVSAARQAKLQPQRSYQRYWQDLSADPLGRAHRPHLSSADLAFEQLRTLLSEANDPDGRLIIAVPAGYTREQLGVLLGIAAEAGVSETGLVDAGLAACALAPVPVHVMHLELYRYRAVVTAVERDGHSSRRARFELDGGWGLAQVEQRCIEVVADNFVKQTRFDPLYRAQTEQVLADGVSGWLQTLQTNEAVPISLAAGAENSHVEFTREQWLMAAEPCFVALLQLVQRARPAGQQLELRVGSCAQSLPGLVARLQGLNSCVVSPLPAGAAARGALRHHAAILRGTHPALVCQLPLEQLAGAGQPPESAPMRAGHPATHVVCDGRAWALRTEPLTVGTQVPQSARALALPTGHPGVSRVHCRLLLRDGIAYIEDLSSYGSFVNEQRVHGQAELKRGDRVRLGAPGIILEIIQLIDEHAAPPL
ncbi:MAG TPA: FHA domain-containing protein [Steroidobacteraceae bacterium]|nr:FHA domain-containing protein [Steroidobacteraceae bacterium]